MEHFQKEDQNNLDFQSSKEESHWNINNNEKQVNKAKFVIMQK